MEAALKAIAAPRRRQILTLVRDDELSAGEIASHFDVTRPAVSQHLHVLKEAGLVSERRNGTRRLYSARPEGLGELKNFLEAFWDVRLEALKREAEKEGGRAHGRTKGDHDGRAEAPHRGEGGEGPLPATRRDRGRRWGSGRGVLADAGHASERLRGEIRMTHPVVHFEVSGRDLDKLQKFYGDLFGWKAQKVPGEMPYAMV